MDDESRLLRAMARRDRAAWSATYRGHVGKTWWKAHELDDASTVLAIRDGEKVRYYRLKDPAWPPKARESAPVGTLDDPGHPPVRRPVHALAPPAARAARPPLDLAADRGSSVLDRPQAPRRPPGTIRVRDTRFPDDGTRPDLYKPWINPTENFISMRSETSVFKPSGPPNIEFIDTSVVETLAKSPGGHAYPTRVRRTTSNLPGDQVTDFYLDFRAEIPDELFRPL